MKRLILLGVLSLTSGCANPKQVMVNAGTWQQVNCSASGWGWLGAPQAISMVNDCINTQKVLGYIPIEEAEVHDGPKFSQELVANNQEQKPIWHVNDSWEYLIGGNTSKIVVDKIENSGPFYYVNTNTGTSVFSNTLGVQKTIKNGTIDTAYDPALRPLEWPLYVGKTWDAAGTMYRNGGSLAVSTHHEVKGYGKIKVPAGEFEAYYILAKSDFGARVTELWYSPAVKYYVKAITYTNTGRIVEDLAKYHIK